MKKLLAIIVCIVFLCGCTPEASLPVNGFGNSGNSYLEWFELTSSEFLDLMNEQLSTSDFPELKIDSVIFQETIELEDGDPGHHSYPVIKLAIHKEDQNIRTLVCYIESKDEYTSKKAGFYFDTLIRMFSPRDAEAAIDFLHIFSEFDDNIAFYEYTAGNTTYKFSGTQLVIQPLVWDEESTLPTRPE